MARARSLPVPDLPNVSNEARLVAALYRELQRDAGDRAFICPVNTIVQFAGLRWPQQARWIQTVLEKALAIRLLTVGYHTSQAREANQRCGATLSPTKISDL